MNIIMRIKQTFAIRRHRKAITLAHDTVKAIAKNDYADMIRESGWDPSEPWAWEVLKWTDRLMDVMPLSPQLLHYRLMRNLDPESYSVYRGGNSYRTITARFTSSSNPDPLIVVERTVGFPVKGSPDMARICIESHRTKLMWRNGQTMVAFDSYGRKMDMGDSRRIDNAQRLVRELTGIELSFDQIAMPDMNHFYRDLVLTKDDTGEWSVHESEEAYQA